MSAPYVLHDIAWFPIVKLRPEACTPGFAELWCAEMTELVTANRPFVLIFEPERMTEDAADFRRRGIWFKHSRKHLAQTCRGMICIIASAQTRASIEVDLAKRSKGFGVPYLAAESISAAESLALELLKPTSQPRDDPRLPE